MINATEVTSRRGLDDIWSDDQLGRREDAAYLEKFLKARIEEHGAAGRKKSYVLNLDSGWGAGKSFFLDRFAAQLRSEGHLVATVNAWRDDFAEDPLVSVMAAIDSTLQAQLPREEGAAKAAYGAVKRNAGRILLTAARGAASNLGRKVIGEEAVSLIGKSISDAAAAAVQGASSAAFDTIDELAQRAIDDFSAAKTYSASFKDNVTLLLRTLSSDANIPMPLFVFVDELDRCRPPFAIAMLERVKHLFDVDNVVFVIATDTDELRHSIQAVYGAGFDSTTYLTRFFDRTYRFEPPSFDQFVRSLFETRPLDQSKMQFILPDKLEDFVVSSFQYFDLQPRTAQQVYELLRTVATTWDYPVGIQIGYMLPFAVAEVLRIETDVNDRHIANALIRRRKSRRSVKSSYASLAANYRERGEKQLQIQTPEVVFRAYEQISHMSLHEIYGRDPPREPAERFAATSMSEEYVKVFGNTGGARSIMTRYPDILRRAGRLADL